MCDESLNIARSASLGLRCITLWKVFGRWMNGIGR